MTRTRSATVALLSMTLIALEVIWTRILSAEFFYTFAFLVISLAILGLGVGALVARLVRSLSSPGAVGALLLGSGLAALAAPPLVLQLGLDFARLLEGPTLMRLVAAILLLASPFVLAGAALARLFRENVAEMPRLYMADLAGAAGGTLVAIVAMNTIEVPRAAALAAAPILAAGVLALGRRRIVAGLAAAAVFVAGFVLMPGLLPETRTDRAQLGPVIWEDWNAMARLKVHEPGKEYRYINIDNGSVAPVDKFDGNFESKEVKEAQFAEHVRALLGGRGGYKVVSLGAGGGRDVFENLVEGAGEIHAVEVNPRINRLLLPGGFLHAYSGRIYADPRVRVVTEDGRAYLRRFDGRFDAILSYSSNSFAALTSGAFALSENYLFTTEAFEDYLHALAPGGFLVMEHQFYIPRAVSEAMEALRRAGVADPSRHVAVYNLVQWKRMAMLVGKAPLTAEQIEAFYGPMASHKDEEIHMLWPPAAKHADNPVARIVTKGWRAEQPASKIDLTPCTDDRPFAAQMGLLRNASWKGLGKLAPIEVQGFPLSKLIILAIIGIVGVVGLPLLALPRLRGERLGAAPWLYFAALGVAFMAVEVVLIQQFTLLIGASSYTFVVILLTLLLASGIGSRFADRTPDWLPFAAVIAWIALDLLLYPAFARGVGALPLGVRIAAAMAAIAPLGFFMGQPFPKGALRAGSRVDWGFAVNGVTSVLGSAAVLLVSMSAGFRIALLAGGAVYAIAGAVLAWQSGWVPAEDKITAPAVEAPETVTLA